MKQKYIEEFRSFNRLYTIIIGVLDKYFLESHLTLQEGRILFELYYKENIKASDLVSSLHMDKGYLSRILKQLERKKLIIKINSGNDKRSFFIKLTQPGKKEFENLNKATDKQVTEILNQLSTEECEQLINNIQSMKIILNKINV